MLNVRYWAKGQTLISRPTQHWAGPQGDDERQYRCFVSFKINQSAIFNTACLQGLRVHVVSK